jgi:DNA-directed RNA polymerase beta subunit
MTPYIARMNNLTYSSNLYVNVNISIEVTNADGMIEKFDKTVNGVYIGKIPIMVRSKSCILYQVNGIGEENNNECRYDFGGYFIVNGNEKVLISQDRINENKTLVFQPNNNIEGLYAEIRSMNDNAYLPPKTTSLNMSGKLNHMGRIIRLNTSFLRSEIPVFVMFRALGVISDKDIIKHIVYDLDNNDNKRIITELMACCEDACDVHTQEQAENILLKILSGANKNTDNRELLKNNLSNDFLPHTGKNYKRKALYLGFMIRKMLRIYMGYDTYDNRDSYMNKRVDTPGILMSNLFRQCYSKMTKELKVVIEKELNLWRANNNITTADIITDVNIRRYFKQSLMESWIKYSLSTGNWGIKSIGSYQNIKQGVSQVLNRMSYSSTLSHLRRINTSMEKNGKLVQPRKLDHSQMGMICPAECFDPDTPILLWNGTIKKAQDIIIGDYLIDDNGNSVRVKSTCSGEKRMYEVIQHKNNFMNYTVTDNHILTLKVKYHKYSRKNKDKVRLEWFDKKELKYKTKHFNNTEDLNEFSSYIDDDNVIDITIEQYLSLPENVQKQLYTFKSNGINWETKEVALDPYILGMWLGDGLSTGYGFATVDKELLDEYIKWGVDNDATITKNKHGCLYTFSSTINNTQTGISCNKTEKAPLKKLLAKYNLVNNKHIPLDYLTNDRKTRLAVLAGLIDTDGNVRANGHEIRICQGEANYKIIYDTEFLARSLGFSCHLNDGTCSYTVNGEKRKRPYKELSITGKNLYEIPTVLPRKKLNKCNNKGHEKRGDSSLQSSFELVQKDIQPFVGWQLDGNGRFLLGDMSISHNTPEGSSVGLVKNMALSTSISVSMNSTHIRNVLKEEGVNIYDDSNTDNDYLDKLGDYNNIYVMVNGDIIGYHNKPNELYTKIKHYKRSGYIYPMTSVIWDIQHRFITISTEAGRMYRPLYIVDIDPITKKRELRINKILKRKGISWEEYRKDKNFDYFIAPCEGSKINDEESYLEEEGFIEYMDCEEINHAMIATFPGDLEKGMKGTAYPPFYTHCEIHPSLMNGILGVNIPFSDHNQSPRNCYQCINQNETVYMSNGTYKQIKDVVVGDKVVCFNPETMINDYTTVVAQYNRLTPKMVYTVSTISGRNIIATYDHKFITNEGWMEVQFINELTKLGIYIKNYNYRTIYISPDVNNNMITFKDTEEYSNIYKDMGLYPLSNTNDKINIIARIAGYYYANKNVFTNKKDADDFNKDVEFIGFQYGVFDTNYVLYFNRLTENIEWLSNCSNIAKIEFIGAYLGATYKSLDNIKETNSSNIPEIHISYVFDNIDETVSKIMEELNINKDWYETNDGIAQYYNKIGARYNYQFLQEIALINEYINYTKYKYRIGWDSDYTIEQWNKLIEFKGDLMFVPFYSKTKNNNHKISDITVESDNHSFIAGNGFAVSNCAMGKQALGVYMSNFNRRIDTMGNILNYPQRSIVRTRLSKYTYSSELPSGTNAIVAIMTHTGFNQEDSIMVNQSALDRGLFTSTYYKAMRDVCTKNHSTGEEEVFTNPTNMTNGKPFSYRKLGDDGFVEKNTYVDANDIIAGKVMPKKTNGVINYQDNSLCMKANDEGYIDMNYSGINSDGYKFCKVRIRKNRKPEIGDKCASTSAQKGTIGMTYKHQDMPFTKDGIVPDIIMNPHAIPSRMTIAQLMECIMGKAGCHIGSFGDATPYNDCSVESIAKVLELSGMERYGNEIMYNGRTGEQIKTEIFIGPTYYQRLKHMVVDKVHSRGSSGPIVMLTRQPSEGRARGGGLRLGEMERDAILGHALPCFLKEKMLDTADNYRIFICKKCGISATVNTEKNIYKCNNCKNSTDIAQVRIPYAFKLLTQELYTMNVMMRYVTN